MRLHDLRTLVAGPLDEMSSPAWEHGGMESVERLVCPVGGSPLPIVRWAEVLRPRTLILMSSTTTRPVAERIDTFYRSRHPEATVAHFVVPPDRPFDVAVAIRNSLGSTPASILYGTGTTPMSVMLHEWWLANCPEEQAYYAAARDGLLHCDDGRSIPPSIDTFTLRSIVDLHVSLPDYQLAIGYESANSLSRLFFSPTDDELDVVGRAAEVLLAAATSRQKMADLSRLMATSAGVFGDDLRDEINALVGRRDPGTLHELVIGVYVAALQRSAQRSPDEMAMSVTVRDNAGAPILEVDLIERRDEVLTAISCGIVADVGTARSKYFEIEQRAQELGGSEARCLAVVLPKNLATVDNSELRDRAGRLRGRLNLSPHLVPHARNALVLTHELVGTDPVARLKDPSSMLGSPDEHIYQWLAGSR